MVIKVKISTVDANDSKSCLSINVRSGVSSRLYPASLMHLKIFSVPSCNKHHWASSNDVELKWNWTVFCITSRRVLMQLDNHGYCDKISRK